MTVQNKEHFYTVSGHRSLHLQLRAGLILCQGYIPEKCHTNRTQNSHLKQCMSWGLGD